MRTAFLSSIAALAVSLASSAFAAEKTLTVYTYESFVSEWGPGPKVKEEFEKTCGCKVEWVGVADGVADPVSRGYSRTPPTVTAATATAAPRIAGTRERRLGAAT